MGDSYKIYCDEMYPEVYDKRIMLQREYYPARIYTSDGEHYIEMGFNDQGKLYYTVDDNEEPVVCRVEKNVSPLSGDFHTVSLGNKSDILEDEVAARAAHQRFYNLEIKPSEYFDIKAGDTLAIDFRCNDEIKYFCTLLWDPIEPFPDPKPWPDPGEYGDDSSPESCAGNLQDCWRRSVWEYDPGRGYYNWGDYYNPREPIYFSYTQNIGTLIDDVVTQGPDVKSYNPISGFRAINDSYSWGTEDVWDDQWGPSDPARPTDMFDRTECMLRATIGHHTMLFRVINPEGTIKLTAPALFCDGVYYFYFDNIYHRQYAMNECSKEFNNVTLWYIRGGA